MRRQTLVSGLATSAVGALALTGLAALPATADAPTARWISQFNAGHLTTTRQDADSFTGGLRTVTLAAEVPDTSADVSFEYNANPAAGDDDGGWTSLGSATTTGAFRTFDWTPPDAVVGTGVPVGLRVAVTPSGGSPTYVTRRDVVVDGPSAPTHGVELSAGGGYFVQPYADSGRTRTLLAASGTTSATDGQVAVAWRPEDGDRRGEVQAAVERTELKVSSGTTIDAGQFATALDISAYDSLSDPIALTAERDTDDVLPVTLYEQVPTQLEYQLPTQTHRSTPVTLSVTDQTLSSPPFTYPGAIAGVEVRRSSDGAVVGYTDGAGQVVVQQAAGTSQTYYANLTDGDALEAGDLTVQVEVPPFVPEVTGVVPVLADGATFDRDEYAAGDVALQVLDQDGEPFAGTTDVEYALYPTGTSAPAMTTAPTDASGRFAVPVDPSASGSYTLDYATPDGDASTTFTIGQASLDLTPGSGTAVSGGQIVFTGRLVLGSEPLAGRTVQLAYVRGTEAAPGTGADAGLTGTVDPLAGTAVSGPDGRFTVTVADPPEAGGPAETGGRLTVTAVGTSASAGADFSAAPAAGTPMPGTPTPTTGGAPTAAAVKLTLTGSSKKGKPDHLHVTAGRAAAGERVTVYRLTGRGKKATWKPVVTRTLSAKGTLDVTVADRNGRQRTSYRVQLKGSTKVLAATSPVCRVS